MKLPRGLTKFRTLSRTDRLLGMIPLVIVYFSMLFVSECEGYWFFSPGRSQRQDNVPAASRRSDTVNNGGGLAQAETLWIGSNKINWSPLPLFLQFTNPSQYKQKQLQQQQQQQKEAQARKFNLNPFQLNTPVNNNKDPFFYQKNVFPYPESIGVGLPPVNPTSASPFPSNPFPSTPFPAFSSPQPYAEARSSTQSPMRLDDYVSINRYSPSPTTLSPIIISSSSPSLADSIFPRDSIITTPGSVSLSTPGDNINPIIAQLKKMTEWSKSKQKTNSFVKKEGKYERNHDRNDRHRDFNRDLKKKLRRKNKDRNNIEAIILADDDADQDAELPTLKRVQKHKRKSSNSKEIGSPSDLVIIHPTNSAYLIDPMEVQQSALKKYQINRKDKTLGMFRSEDAIERPAPFSFKFGPQDAKPSPYRH